MTNRIPIVMCHGIRPDTPDVPLTESHVDTLARVAADLGCESIGYDDLARWRDGADDLPARPVMFDFDHPVRCMRYAVHDILARYGFRGNLFVNTGPLTTDPIAPEYLSWAELAELVDLGWDIGAHTVTHPDLSVLSQEDPDGLRLQDELQRCDAAITEHLGLVPRDFAYTGTSYSSAARRIVESRYRFGRLWITQSHYDCDGERIRFAELVGSDQPDEADGGPPEATRYVTRDSDPYLLPAMEIQALIYQPAAFRSFLERAYAP